MNVNSPDSEDLYIDDNLDLTVSHKGNMALAGNFINNHRPVVNDAMRSKNIAYAQNYSKQGLNSRVQS